MKTDTLRHYTILVDFLGKTLGPDYEIVLQDLTSKRNIIAIANGHISDRKVGSPLTNAALHLLSAKTYKDRDYVCNYKGITKGNKVLRSSTMFIKDDEGNPIGLLCINFDDSRYEELQQQLNGIIHPESFISDITHEESQAAHMDTENFTMDIPGMMEKMYSDATHEVTVSSDRLNQNEKKEIVETLHDQGMFQLKGAIPFVAKKLRCSSATIYRYLSEITS